MPCLWNNGLQNWRIKLVKEFPSRKMLVKVHSSYRTVVAICDTSLLGKKFEEGRFQLDVRENFYKGDEVSPAKLIPLIKDYASEDATFNIVGQESVSLAVKAGLIQEECIKTIQGIPFAMVLV